MGDVSFAVTWRVFICMVPQLAWMPIRRTAAAMIALLALVTYAPSRAAASCGDYVLIGERSGHSSPAAEGLRHGNEPVQGRGRVRSAHERSSAPCHGPSCSKGPWAPAAPTPTISAAGERWAVSAAEATPAAQHRGALVASPCLLPCNNCTLSILRPPR